MDYVWVVWEQFTSRPTQMGGHADGQPGQDPAHLCTAHLHQAYQVQLLQQGNNEKNDKKKERKIGLAVCLKNWISKYLFLYQLGGPQQEIGVRQSWLLPFGPVWILFDFWI